MAAKAVALLAVALALFSGGRVFADRGAAPASGFAGALPPEKWGQLQKSVDRALAWLATEQSPSGAFPTIDAGQPAVTSFCVMAFLSRGHRPGVGPYGQQLDRAIDFVLDCQKEDGLLSYGVPEPYYAGGPSISHAASYNHAIAGLMLGEVYGHVTGQRARRVRKAIVKALEVSRDWQSRAKPFDADRGGVRYRPIKPGEADADLSITAWTLMFYRSARNAEFNVPQPYVNEAVAYVRRCWDPGRRMFNYIAFQNGGKEASRGMTGAGILALSLAGQHDTAIARAAGDWLVAHPYQVTLAKPMARGTNIFTARITAARRRRSWAAITGRRFFRRLSMWPWASRRTTAHFRRKRAGATKSSANATPRRWLFWP